jgi:anhydro-N-acetylmuramic acid kinase
LLASKRPFEELVATATALTASTIAAAIQRFVAPRVPVHDLIVSGGGAHNPQIMGMLAALLPRTKVQTSSDHGIDVDAKEAIAFAILAHQTWRRKPSNLPSATGAKRAVILGKISR